MTTPSLTPDGHMHWSPHNWTEGLCHPQADGSWLVQAPIWGKEAPLLYVLPDAAAKEGFLTRSGLLIRMRVIISATVPVSGLLLAGIAMVPLAAGSGAAVAFILLLGLVPLLLRLAHYVCERRLFGWLAERAVHPPTAWQCPPILIRTAEEWGGLYLSNGWGLACVIDRVGVGVGVAGMAIVLTSSAYLNLCHGFGVLDGLFLGTLPRESGLFCGESGPPLGLVSLMLLVFECWSLQRIGRRRRAGGAVLLIRPD